MPPAVDEIVSQVPGWADAEDLQIESLAGLTNANYSVTVDGEHFVLRLSGENAGQLGINRELELEALIAASKGRIAPQVVYFILPEGHLVTRYIDGRHLTLEEYRTQRNIQRIVNKVKRLHALPLVKATFSPFRRVEAYVKQTQAMRVPCPHDLDRMIQKMEAIERAQARDSYPRYRFCHNDLFYVNVLDDGDIWFVDWEFAGVGDVFYDLATLTYAYDSEDTLPRELQEYVLACYFGEVGVENRVRLAGMKVMVMFFNAMWALLQHGMQRDGQVRVVEGFDFMKYAEATFEALRRGI